MAKLNPAWIVGRTIAAVEMNAARVPDGPGYRTMHNPTVTLDNGAKLFFLTEEDPNGGEYGVDIGYVPPPRRSR